MSYAVQIRKNDTGEIRFYTLEALEDDGDYIWTDGNFSCDCNRAIMFDRAKDQEIPEWWLKEPTPYPCSDGAFSVLLPDARYWI